MDITISKEQTKGYTAHTVYTNTYIQTLLSAITHTGSTSIICTRTGGKEQTTLNLLGKEHAMLCLICSDGTLSIRYNQTIETRPKEETPGYKAENEKKWRRKHANLR